LDRANNLEEAAKGNAGEGDVDETSLLAKLIVRRLSSVKGEVAEHTWLVSPPWQQTTFCLQWLLRISPTPMTVVLFLVSNCALRGKERGVWGWLTAGGREAGASVEDAEAGDKAGKETETTEGLLVVAAAQGEVIAADVLGLLNGDVLGGTLSRGSNGQGGDGKGGDDLGELHSE